MIYRIALGLVFIHVMIAVFFTYYLTSQKKYDSASVELTQGCKSTSSQILEPEKVLKGLQRIVQEFSIEGTSAVLSNQYGHREEYQIVKNTELTSIFFNGDQYSFGLLLNEIPSFEGNDKLSLCVVSMIFSQNINEGQLAWFIRRRSFKQSLTDLSRSISKK